MSQYKNKIKIQQCKSIATRKMEGRNSQAVRSFRDSIRKFEGEKHLAQKKLCEKVWIINLILKLLVPVTSYSPKVITVLPGNLVKLDSATFTINIYTHEKSSRTIWTKRTYHRNTSILVLSKRQDYAWGASKIEPGTNKNVFYCYCLYFEKKTKNIFFS